MFNPGDKVWCSWQGESVRTFTATYVGPEVKVHQDEYVLVSVDGGEPFAWLKECVHQSDPGPARKLALAQKKMKAAERALKRAIAALNACTSE